uniref:MHC class I-like antigen recognition-like domain-containing protein n=1 Tax=Propithecus coquereli TaxID=379532 RepID=A0A2K6GV43_PROCO
TSAALSPHSPHLPFCSTETHSLSYDFTITPKFRPAPRWCEVQGQVDKKTFLHYDCANKKGTPCGPLGKEINGTITWKEQKETLSNVVEDLTQELLDNLPENYTASDPLTLEVRMSCQLEANGHTTGSWQFGFNGQKFLLFDSEDREWALAHPRARQMKEKWENDKDVTKFFHNISVGDCRRWLMKFLVHWEKMLQPTGK